MAKTEIRIKGMSIDGDVAVRIMKCLKKHEPDIFETLKNEISNGYGIGKKRESILNSIISDIGENTKLKNLNISTRLHNCLMCMIRENRGHDTGYSKAQEMTIKEINNLLSYKDFSRQRNCGKKTWEEYLEVLSICELRKRLPH